MAEPTSQGSSRRGGSPHGPWPRTHSPLWTSRGRDKGAVLLGTVGSWKRHQATSREAQETPSKVNQVR